MTDNRQTPPDDTQGDATQKLKKAGHITMATFGCLIIIAAAVAGFGMILFLPLLLAGAAKQ